MTISIIIPTYNEKRVFKRCIESLNAQTRDFELIIVDDGSTDRTLEVFKSIPIKQKKIIVQTNHNGPAAARNLGAKNSSGEILVFVDADMTFEKDFLATLVRPIEVGETQGTFSKEEFVANWENVWARCWNYNQGFSTNRRISKDYPNKAPVFRAIRASEFHRVQGFTAGIGWTDDWTLSRKLGYSSSVTSARYYHANPDTLVEVYKQARWIGKNEFISGNFMRRVVNSVRYSLPVSITGGFVKSFRFHTPYFLLFKLVYDAAIFVSIFATMFGEDRNK